MDHQLSTKFNSVLGSRKHVCVSVTDLSKWRTFRPTLDREAATTDSGKPCKKKIRLATNYAFWCTNTTMWNSRSKLISTPFPHLRENSSKFRLSGPITAVTHNKSFSDCFFRQNLSKPLFYYRSYPFQVQSHRNHQVGYPPPFWVLSMTHIKG